MLKYYLISIFKKPQKHKRFCIECSTKYLCKTNIYILNLCQSQSQRYPCLGQDKAFCCFDMKVTYIARACSLGLPCHASFVAGPADHGVIAWLVQHRHLVDQTDLTQSPGHRALQMNNSGLEQVVLFSHLLQLLLFDFKALFSFTILFP